MKKHVGIFYTKAGLFLSETVCQRNKIVRSAQRHINERQLSTVIECRYVKRVALCLNAYQVLLASLPLPSKLSQRHCVMHMRAQAKRLFHTDAQNLSLDYEVGVKNGEAVLWVAASSLSYINSAAIRQLGACSIYHPYQVIRAFFKVRYACVDFSVALFSRAYIIWVVVSAGHLQHYMMQDMLPEESPTAAIKRICRLCPVQPTPTPVSLVDEGFSDLGELFAFATSVVGLQ